MTEAGLVRKTVYSTLAKGEAIRLAAREQDVVYSHLVQQAVRAVPSWGHNYLGHDEDTFRKRLADASAASRSVPSRPIARRKGV